MFRRYFIYNSRYYLAYTDMLNGLIDIKNRHDLYIFRYDLNP